MISSLICLFKIILFIALDTHCIVGEQIILIRELQCSYQKQNLTTHLQYETLHLSSFYVGVYIVMNSHSIHILQ